MCCALHFAFLYFNCIQYDNENESNTNVKISSHRAYNYKLRMILILYNDNSYLFKKQCILCILHCIVSNFQCPKGVVEVNLESIQTREEIGNR